ncbi:PfkB family carbohydrate kinase [Herbiconiux sp. SYSU D00978]|uniref:PfkB family carbohydrate kinase n=1 Tax=Herbiconiux sp. SYSU D00978 TaxID=2812562 RepID=UPI001A961D88|nr:PfkB family carbohydrate kinase [Herbiconiux sp. SYSU D00978]
MRVAGFGDNIVDRFIDRQVMYPGGNCVNYAVYARQLGVDSSYVGVFGNDAHGRLVHRVLDSLGIDLRLCVIRDGENGATNIEVVDGERYFRGWNEGGVTTTDPFRLTDDHIRYLSGFDLVHSSVFSASVPELPALRRTGALISYDFSDDPEHRTPAYLAEVVPHLDLALLSFAEEDETEIEEELRRVRSYGSALVLGTRGPNGAMLFDGTEIHSVRAEPIDPERFKDTMGCGDAFLAAFTLALLRSGWTRTTGPSSTAIATALECASRYAALQCYVEGAFAHGCSFADAE